MSYLNKTRSSPWASVATGRCSATAGTSAKVFVKEGISCPSEIILWLNRWGGGKERSISFMVSGASSCWGRDKGFRADRTLAQAQWYEWPLTRCCPRLPWPRFWFKRRMRRLKVWWLVCNYWRIRQGWRGFFMMFLWALYGSVDSAS